MNRLIPLCTRPLLIRNLVRFSSLERGPSGQQIKPSAHEKFFLVWYGNYKTKADIPELISVDVHTKLRNKIRVSISNYGMIITLIICLGMVWTGKRAASRGESIQKMNMDWHKQINEQETKDSK